MGIAEVDGFTQMFETEYIFFDCDDCCYQNDWKTADKISNAIGTYTKDKLGVSSEKAYALYQQHGTCLKGLLVENVIDEEGVEDFLFQAHDIDYSDIKPDPELKEMLSKLRSESTTDRRLFRFVFTASIKEHASRCLEKVGILEMFPAHSIIDTRTCELNSKHAEVSFKKAMEFAKAGSLEKAGKCMLLDDNVKNIKAAKAVGWRTCLVGKVDRDTGAVVETPVEADTHIGSLLELKDKCPDLFEG